MQSGDATPKAHEFLGRLLREDLRLAPVGLAQAMGISRARMHYILKGRTPITANTAIRLEIATGVAAEYWLELQAASDLSAERSRNAAEFNQLRRIDAAARLSHLPEHQRT